MNFDIASELSGLFDFSKTIPSLTISFIAASGILLLCACILVTFTARRIVGLRFMPVLYGATSYLLFYIMIGRKTFPFSKFLPIRSSAGMSVPLIISRASMCSSI